MNNDEDLAKKEMNGFWDDYQNLSKEEKIMTWERMIYWDFKNSYRQEHIDYFTPQMYEYMKSKDPNLYKIVDEVIERFNNFIMGDEKSKIEIRKRMKIDEKA
jgi:hypothetical protein